MLKLSFSGHETFVCRQSWLKKGYDYLQQGLSFNNDDAVIRLGVGKNMVTAIKFWLRGYSIIDQAEHISKIGHLLFNEENGLDPYLEDITSLWLLHYYIVKNQRVFIFNAFFNEFTKEKSEFTKEQLIAFLKRKTQESEQNIFSDKTYEADANVFLRTYVRSNDGKVDLEDETANLLVDLSLISTFTKENVNGKKSQWYRINKAERRDLSKHLLLFSLLDVYEKEGSSISFYDMLEGYNSVGVIFSLTEQGLDNKLKEIAEYWTSQLSYTSTAGNRVLQIKRPIDKWEILKENYV